LKGSNHQRAQGQENELKAIHINSTKLRSSLLLYINHDCVDTLLNQVPEPEPEPEPEQKHPRFVPTQFLGTCKI